MRNEAKKRAQRKYIRDGKAKKANILIYRRKDGDVAEYMESHGIGSSEVRRMVFEDAGAKLDEYTPAAPAVARKKYGEFFRVTVSFFLLHSEDRKAYEHFREQPNKAQYVIGLVRRRMAEDGKGKKD